MESTPMTLVDVREIIPIAQHLVASFERDHADLLADAEVHHIGATSLPFGYTKGDVDVNVRVDEAVFPPIVAAFGERLATAQPDNWSATFASFSADGYALPLGVQVTVIGSDADFLLALRDRMRADPPALQRYKAIKQAAASEGPDAYCSAKDRLLRELLTE
jgi:GrpB-like predicted nucleotidyltransferase (UPF0157 family)